MRISDWSSDVCSSDLKRLARHIVVSPCGSDFRSKYPVQDIGGKLDSRKLAGAQTNMLDLLVGLVDRRRMNGNGPEHKDRRQHRKQQIGRASCRERVCQYV